MWKEGIKLIVAAPRLYQEGICKLLESEKDIRVIARTSTFRQVIPAVKRKKPDVLFIAMPQPHPNTLKVLESLRVQDFETKALVLSNVQDQGVIMDVISSGIRGYLAGGSGSEQLFKAIRAVPQGEIWAERKIITMVLDRVLFTRKYSLKQLKPKLSKREQEVIGLVAQGYRNKQISRKLLIQEQTVKNYIARAFKKIGVSSRIQLTLDFLDNSTQKPIFRDKLPRTQRARTMR